MNSTKDLTLVIGDAHIDYSQRARNGLRRFKWANKLIRDRKPARVVIIGDFLTFESLSAWNKDKRKNMEGKRYAKDILVGNDALDIMLGDIPVKDMPELIYLKGNHEYRLDRYLEYDPTFEDAIGLEQDLGLIETGFQVFEYKEDYTYKGVSFTHVPIMENGKPVTGKYATQKALDIYDNSVVFGHIHKLDVACVHRHRASSLQQAVNVGCFFEHVDDYARGSVTSYWRGLVLLDHYDKGRVDIETISLGALKRKYSD